MALPGNVTTAINNCALKMSQLDPGANATANNQRLTAACTNWPAASVGTGWGRGPWNTTKAAAFCNWMAGLGVNVAALRSYFGV